MTKKISEKEVYRGKIFTIKDVEVEHAGNKNATHQILQNFDASIIVPLKDDGRIIFIKEYHTAHDEYNLDLPGGKIDPGSDERQTAERELQEEIGYKANKIYNLGMLTISPAYLTQKSYIFLATELSPSKLEGDEPEELELLEYPFEKFEELIEKGELKEARAIAALYLARKYVNEH